MAAEHNPVFDIYRNNLAFTLRLSHLMLENQQRLQQCKAQAEERSITATAKVAEAVTGAQDWASLSTLSNTLIRRQTELASAFWQDFFSALSNNQMALQNGMHKAAEDLQTGSKTLFQGYSASPPQSRVFEDMFKPFEPFANALAAYNQPTQAVTAKHGANHSG
jgi:hypothetical protein